MGLRIHNQKDFAAGLIYVAFGAAFAIGSLDYKMGDAARMGPAYFPFWVGVLLVVVGVFTAAAGLRGATAPEKLKKPELASIGWIIGSVVLFGLLLNQLGLVLSLAVLILVSMRASHEFRWAGALATTVALIAFSTFTFIWGIEMQIDLWPAWFS